MKDIYKPFYLFCIFPILLFFINCLTINLRDYQKRESSSFYKFERPAYVEMRILQKKNRPILELSYLIRQERKFRHYCSTPLEIKGNQSDEYSYDVQNRKLNQECEFKAGDSDLKARIEDAEKKLFLYELGTAIHLNWKNSESRALFIYRGQPIRKKISDVREAWTVNVKQDYFDRKLCIADSKNRIVALDCSKPESDKPDFLRYICTQAEIDCSKQPNTSSLTLSEIPRTPPTYFSISPGKIHHDFDYYLSYRKNVAVWLSDRTASQTTSQILQIEFNPEIKTFHLGKVAVYGASYLMYPVTIAIDILTAPIVLAALWLTFRD
ncbi:hypothetical protein [Leptospira alstonii]|uniref:hypothetical protein n=1 Tax=Leptospira alstonii TaxID=28452 RepID=UPI000774AA83|nr:hypothetical protein [Leptospira alstonii]